MKYVVSALMLSIFMPTLASANPLVNDLGYPFDVPADMTGSSIASYDAIFSEEIMEAILHPLQITVKTSQAVKEFLENPKLRDYFIRELQTFENMPDVVTKAYVTAVSVLNEETGENFIALFSPHPEQALDILSKQRNFLPEEAKIEYFLHPKMESGEFFSEDQKAEIMEYIKHIKIIQPETVPFSNIMGDFEIN